MRAACLHLTQMLVAAYSYAEDLPSQALDGFSGRLIA